MQPSSKIKKRRTNHWLNVFLIVLCIGIIAVIALSLSISQLDVSKLGDPLPEPTIVFDHNGAKVSQLTSAKSDPVRLKEVPLHMQSAMIAAEDRRFYEHPGVDVRSIARALVRDIRAGDFAEGGSTITQQLAKNMFLPTDKSLSRKLNEAAYALKIDLTYDKNEILELYLNRIYFGEGAWGIRAASQHYFSKEVNQLTLEESALLAAIPKAPSNYSPNANPENALERRNLVLSLMKEQFFITDAEYAKSIKQPIALKIGEKKSLVGQYAPYVDYVIEEAIKRYGFTEDQLLSGGLNIYTEMDPKVQKATQDVIADPALFPEGKPDQLMQSGAVLLDPHTGGVRGLVGYRGEGVFRGFNRATQLKRQPGSAFKPLAVYGAALEKGYTPESVLYDGVLDVAGYRPEDWDHQTRGQVTMLEAIVQSWNIPAVWLLHDMGIGTGMGFAKKLGIPLDEQKDRTLGLALGGLDTGVSPLDMAQAYSAFANQGVMHAAHAITKISTRDGHVLVEAAPASSQVMQPATASTMTFMLQQAVARGTGQLAALERPVAGKTGTTELPATAEFTGAVPTSAKDAWFVGYTPELTAAIWVGYDRTDKDHYINTAGGSVPAKLFREIMTRSLQGVPITNFILPAPLQAQAPAPVPSPAQVKENNSQQQPDNKQNGKSDQGGGHKPKGKKWWQDF